MFEKDAVAAARSIVVEAFSLAFLYIDSTNSTHSHISYMSDK